MLARFFVDRPVFATVLSVVIIIIGLVALVGLPIAQYPEVVPPTIQISTTYPGANAKVVADTVAAPIEQEVNGVENMLYMSSRSSNDGTLSIDVTFRLGTDIDEAQVLVQNRVAIAEAKLPEEVKRQGVTTKKKSPSILMCVNLISTPGGFDQLYLSNYATIQIKDSLARLPGVGDVTFLGARDYAMRIWLKPEQLASRNMTAIDVLNALREQNVQVAAGRVGQPPAPAGVDFQLTINTLGRLLSAEQFDAIVVKRGANGEIVRLSDIGRTELGAKNYDVDSFLDGEPCVTMAVFQLPGSNALATAEAVRSTMERLKERFPKGLEYRIVYDTTMFVEESVHEVYKTLFEAFVLVFIVVLLFLQDWRATLMPMIDVPVSLIGTLAVMQALGFSLNNLSMLGLVVAIGIVVDDAIVVVENIERWMSKGLPPREAVIKAMDEITGPVIAITLVLCSVFIPTAFIAGIPGQFFRQFALTIAAATVISAINAMTMAPARAVTLIKPHGAGHKREALPKLGVALIFGMLADAYLKPLLLPLFGIHAGGHGAPVEAASSLQLWGIWAGVMLTGAVIGWFANGVVNYLLLRLFDAFNVVVDVFTNYYGKLVAHLLRLSVFMLLLYGALIGLTVRGFQVVPMGFIPAQDKGYLVINMQLPDGASLERSQQVAETVTKLVRETRGVAHTITVPGYSIVTSVNSSNSAGMFVILSPFEERMEHPDLRADGLVAQLRAKLSKIQEASIAVFGAPPIDGLGSTAGLKMQVQDRGELGPEGLQGMVSNLVSASNAQGSLAGAFSSFQANQPQLFVDVDREKAKSLGIPLSDVFETLQINLGSSYANDFTRFGRNWQVNLQADSEYRMRTEDIGKLKVRNASGDMVPLATLISISDVSGPGIVYRFNMYPSADLVASPGPGGSSGTAISLMEEIAKRELPPSMGTEWTELAFEQIEASKDVLTKMVFPLAVVFVFLVLAAQFESWSMPLAILLIVPMCLLAALAGLWITGMDNNIFTQIGLVVLIALAAKNAILIVEFAKQLQAEGMSLPDATVEACKARLRPILMTSFAFILGVVPLITGLGAGYEMRYALGLAVFSGMLGVTFFGVVFTPVFNFVVVRYFEGSKPLPAPAIAHSTPEAASADIGPAH